MNQTDSGYGQNTYSDVNQNTDNSSSSTTSSYSSAGRQSRSSYRNSPSPEACLSPTSVQGMVAVGYGSPVPRRCKSPGVQLLVPVAGEIDSCKTMIRYRSCSPGRRNALIGMEGQQQQQTTNQNIMNNNPYGSI